MSTGAVRKVVATTGETSLSASVTASGEVHLESSEGAWRTEVLGPGLLAVDSPAGRRLAYVAADGEQQWVFVDGDVVLVEVEATRRARRRGGGGHDALAAPMPATVIAILAAEGTSVTRGDTLLILEAMKMELPIKAPRDGRVRAVSCREGELVQPGVPLLELE